MKFHVFQAALQDDLKRARTINKRLTALVSDGRSTSPTVSWKVTKAIRIYKTVSEHATELYSIIKEKLNTPGCQCDSHEAALQLNLSDLSLHTNACPFRFRTFLSLQIPESGITWQGLDVEKVEEAQDNTSDIEKVPQTSTQSTTIVNSPSLAPPQVLINRYVRPTSKAEKYLNVLFPQTTDANSKHF